MAIKTVKIMADFETTTSPDDLRVWAGCAVDINTFEVMTITKDIAEFMQYLSNKNSVVYWHNLKFDGEFLLSYLLLNGFKLSKTPADKTFDCLITDDGLFYSITIIFEKKNKKYRKATVYDSLKKLPFKVSEISKAFKLEDSKGSIDYDEYRPVGHELTDTEKDYIIKDCRIVAQALHTQFSQGLDRMTNASDAMYHFKQTIGPREFDKLFPVFPLEMDNDLRKAYKGGFVAVNPKYQNMEGLQGLTFDVNSLYPSRMYEELLPWGYPVYFEGEYVQDDKFPLYIVQIQADFEVKPDHIPILQLKKNRSFRETEYLKSSQNDNGEWTYPIFTVTNVDLELIKEHYTLIDPVYICGYKFKGKKGIFKEYIDYWMRIKETNTGALRTLAKLMLNSLYGRFALNPKVVNKIPVLNESGVVRYIATDTKNEEDRKIVEEYQGFSGETYRDAVYTPMACFITAYARKLTITTCQALYDRWIYADTDSCHLTGFNPPENMEIHDTKLGAWKHEGTFVNSKFIRAKTYMETMEKRTKNNSLHDYCRVLNKTFDVWRNHDHILYHDTVVTCAGMPDNVKYLDLGNEYDKRVTYDTFTPGSSFFGKLAPKRYRGGVVLVPGWFTIH